MTASVYYDDEGAVLPPFVQAWLGLASDCGVYDADCEQNLAKDNDTGASFRTIAKTIRSGRLLLND